MAWQQKARVPPCSSLSLITVLLNSGESVKRPENLLHLVQQFASVRHCMVPLVGDWVILKAGPGGTSADEHAAGRVLMVRLNVISYSPMSGSCQHRVAASTGMCRLLACLACFAAALTRRIVRQLGNCHVYLQGFKPAQA